MKGSGSKLIEQTLQKYWEFFNSIRYQSILSITTPGKPLPPGCTNIHCLEGSTCLFPGARFSIRQIFGNFMGKNVSGTFSLSFKEPPMALASRCCCTVSYCFLHKWYHRGGDQRTSNMTQQRSKNMKHNIYTLEMNLIHVYRINNLTHG